MPASGLLSAINPSQIVPYQMHAGGWKAPCERLKPMKQWEGQVLSVARDSKHRFGKQIQESITLIEGYGVIGDAHAGHYAKRRFLGRTLTTRPNKRQVHLIPAELFIELR